MRLLFFLLMVLIVSGCSKDPDEIPYQKINVPVITTFRDIEKLDDGSLVLCGGVDQMGIVMKSIDNGTNWLVSQTKFDNPVNALYFLSSDTGFAADADILIYRTTDGGMNWEPFYASSWPLTVNRNLRDITFLNDSLGVVCGGKNYGNGVVYTSSNKGDSWSFTEYEHELRSVCFTDAMNGVICGYSTLMVTHDGGATFTKKEEPKDFFTGVVKDFSGKLWMCAFNGNIYSSINQGENWNKVRETNSWNTSVNQLNCIDISPLGKIACAGPNGFIVWSTDGGANWNERLSFDGNDILQLEWNSENELFAVGKNGGVYKIGI